LRVCAVAVSVGHRNEGGWVIDRRWHGQEEVGFVAVVDAG